MQINYDLENSPLQIRTDSVVGSNERVTVWFYNALGSYHAGGLALSFSFPPQYGLGWCGTSDMNFPTDLPSETDKIWMLSLSRTSDVPRLALYCNNKEVLNLVISGTTCSDGSWTTTWSRLVGRIEFVANLDTASDYYRQGKP